MLIHVYTRTDQYIHTYRPIHYVGFESMFIPAIDTSSSSSIADVEEHDPSLSSIASSFRWSVTIPAAAGIGDWGLKIV